MGLYARHAALDFLYVTIWKKFFKANPKIPEPSSSWPFPEELKDPEILGNFWGILIVNNHIDFLPLENIVNNPRIIKALLPFLCCMRNANIEDLTVCVMDNQAIYISMLGQLEDDPPHYVLFSNNLSSRKFGELVAHGHRLGILRFASVVPSGKLGEAAHMVSSIGAEIDDALKDNASAKAMQNRIDHINGRFAELDKLFVGGDLRRRLLQSPAV